MQEEAACDGEGGRLPWFTSLTGTIRRARLVGYYSKQTKWKASLSFTSAMQPWGESGKQKWSWKKTSSSPEGSIWKNAKCIKWHFATDTVEHFELLATDHCPFFLCVLSSWWAPDCARVHLTNMKGLMFLWVLIIFWMCVTVDALWIKTGEKPITGNTLHWRELPISFSHCRKKMGESFFCEP